MIGLRSAKSAGVPTDYVSLESLRLSGRFIVYSILCGSSHIRSGLSEFIKIDLIIKVLYCSHWGLEDRI